MFCALVIAGGLALRASTAPESNKRTILTVSQTVQIGDTVLQPGQYLIKLLDSETERHVVQIFNKDESHIIATIVTVPVERIVPHGHTTFTFYETPAGTARALRTWYYPGDLDGQQFLESKHHEMLAASTAVVDNPLSFDQDTNAQQTTTAATQATTAETSTTAQAQPATSDSQSADRQVTEPASAPPAEAAQPAAPAASTEVAAAAPAPAPEPTPAVPAELPQTATSYPEVAFIGFALLALALVARLAQRA